MRRQVAWLILGVAALAVTINFRAGNPLGQIPRVGPPPADLAARFSRPPTWEFGAIESPDGARLRYGTAKPMSPVRATIVVVGGYTEFAEKYFETFNDLLARGYAVGTLDWRGQGGSQRYLANPQKAHSIGFAHDRADLDYFLRQFSGPPIYLLAHSMGGNIALRLLHDHPGIVRAAILSAPALRIGSRAGMPPWQARTLSGLMLAAGLGESYALRQHDWLDDTARNAQTSPVSHDAARDQMAQRWFRERPELRLGGGTYRWVYEFYNSCATVMGANYLEEIRTPVLLGSAGQDSFVDSTAHEEACTRLPSCRIVRYPGARHELLMETDEVRGPWLNEIDEFVRAIEAVPAIEPLNR
jgi:lysophospholipase